MRTFAIGDIHGAHKALIQCLDRSGFDKEKDRLIVLGDVCDGWPEVKQCFDELLTLDKMVYIIGNHDDWALEWYARAGMYRDNPLIEPEPFWVKQGGQATIDSYDGKDMTPEHLKLLQHASVFYTHNKNQIFVHGGFDPKGDIHAQSRHSLIWDRSLLRRAKMVHGSNPDYQINSWRDIFIGHTDIGLTPLRYCNVWCLDTGAGWTGKLTIMDTETYEFWQSDNVLDLYKGVQGRMKLRH